MYASCLHGRKYAVHMLGCTSGRARHMRRWLRGLKVGVASWCPSTPFKCRLWGGGRSARCLHHACMVRSMQYTCLVVLQALPVTCGGGHEGWRWEWHHGAHPPRLSVGYGVKEEGLGVCFMLAWSEVCSTHAWVYFRPCPSHAEAVTRAECGSGIMVPIHPV